MTVRLHDWKLLVDMPGLDSGLRTHNAAIQRYLPLGSYFILVVDVEHGALRATEIEQLREFLDRDVEFAVLVNKIDKKQDDATAVVEHIRQQVREAFETSVGVFPVSAHAGDIDAFRRVVEAIDFDSPLRNFWRTRLVQLFDDAVASLQTRYSALNVSAADRERAVVGLEEEKQALEAKLRDDEQDVRERYSDRAVDRILGGVRDAIRHHAAPLARTWQSSGRQAFEHEFNEVVRRTLNRVVDKERRETLAQLIDRYDADFAAIDAHHVAFLRAGTNAATLDIPGELAGHVSAAAQASAQAFHQAASKRIAGSTAATAVTGVLAAATSIVAPWLEVLMIALPAIISWLREKTAETQRQQRMQEQLKQMEAQISSVIAPRTASELRDLVSEDYASVARDLIAGLGAQVSARVERIQADIDRSRAEIEEQKRNVAQRKEQLRAAIARMTEARNTVAEEA